MHLVNNIKISTRITLGFGLLLLLIVMLITVSFYGLTSTEDRLDAIARENRVKTELLQEMRFVARHEAVIIRNILLLRDTEQKKNEVKRRAEAQKRYQELENKFTPLALDEQSTKIVAGMIEGRKLTQPLWDKVVQFGLENRSEEGTRLLVTEVRQVQWKWLDSLDELHTIQIKQVEENTKDAEQGYHRALTLLAVFAIVAFVLGSAVAYLITRSLTQPLAIFTKNVGLLAQGDLTAKVSYDSKDELGHLGKQINHMTESFGHMVNSILTSANEVVESVSVLKARSSKTAEGAKTQSGQASQIATAAEEMSQTITEISKNSSSVADSAADAKKTAESGKEVTATAVEKVNSVYTSTVELAERVERLNTSTAEISEIVTFIKGIADQTNLLALNAAIEAARAGEQGRGFAVVADEVRKLAERTIKATTEISDKITAVQQESEQTRTAMNEASGEVTKAREYVTNAGNSLHAVLGSVEKVSDQISRIAVAVEEQSSASDEVAKNAEQTTAVARDMEKMAHDVTQEIHGLTKVAEELRSVTSGFKTTCNSLMILNLAKTDHRLFVEKIDACVTDGAALDPDQLPSHESCRLGKWYFSEGKHKFGALPAFTAIDAPHATIHAMAKDAVFACRAGDKKKAESMLVEMEALSERIGGMLDDLKKECNA